MATLNQTDLQKLRQEVQRLAEASGTSSGGAITVADGAPSVTGTESTGDSYFDPTANNLYIFNNSTWTLTGDFTWIRYATDVNNKMDDGTVANANDVVGFRDTLTANVKWIGELFNQITAVESTDPRVYYWRLAPAGLLTTGIIDTSDTPTAPINFAAADELYQTNKAAGIKSRVLLGWTNPATGAPASTNLVSFKLSADATYTSFGEFGTENCIIPDLLPGTYDFRVEAVTSLGVKSTATDLLNSVVQGLTANPLNPSNLSLNAGGEQALLTWDKATDVDLDVLVGGSVQIRYHPSTGAVASWNTAQTLVESLAGTTTSKTIPLLIGTYLIKFIDSGGRESPDPAVVTNTFAPAGFNFVTMQQQDNTFLGAKTNCTVTLSTLRLTSGQTVMTYDYHTTIDLKSIKSVRVAPTFDAEIINVSDILCNVPDVCAVTTFCGTQTDAEISFFISTTQDDVSGSPTFSDYQTLIAGDYSARGIRIRIVATAGDTNTVISFKELGVSIDTVDTVKIGTITTLTTGDITETYGESFYTGVAGTTVPRIGTQIIGGSQGDELIVGTSSATGFTASVFNGGSRVVRTVHYQAIGQ